MIVPCKTQAELIENDLVHAGWVVTYECVESSKGWGKVGDENRIHFEEYNPTNFQAYAPKGWIIRTIDPQYMVDR